MKYPVVLSERAEDQLESSFSWWAKRRSEEQAIRWYNGFLDALESLSENPERCAIANENARFVFEVRQLRFGLGRKPSHRALFTIRPDMVYVFSIRHISQDEASPERL